MLSVTSDTAATLSLQSLPRSARTDQSPDSFSTLIDGNVAEAAGNERAAPDGPSPRPADASTASDKPRDASASNSSNPAANTPSRGTQPETAPSVAADGNVDAACKPRPAKQAVVKSPIKDAASDIVGLGDAAFADPTASPQPAAAAVTPAPIAIAVPVAATVTVAVPASPDNAAQPLAIAAAAIATSASTVEASKPVVTAAKAPIDPAPKAPASPAPEPGAMPTAAPLNSATTAGAAEPVTVTTTAAQATANDSITAPVMQPANADAVTQADPELAAAVVLTTPAAAVAPKPVSKASTAVRSNETVAAIKTDTSPTVSDPSAAPPSPGAADKGVAPQTQAADSRQKADGTTVDAAKAEAAKAQTPIAAAATPSPHEHRASAAVQAQTDVSDATQQASSILQPPAQSTTAVPAPQLNVTVPTSAAVPLNGLALQIAVSAQSGKSRFEIRLDPAELGRIDVRIDVDRHGQVTSHLTVEKPETLAMLRQDAPQLQRALDNAGFRTGDGGLQFSLRDQSSSGHNAGDEAGRHAQRLIISEDDSVPAAVAGRTYGRMPGSGSGVDIRV